MAIGRLFTIAANFTDPDAYFVGGGVVEAAPDFRDWFLAKVRENTVAARGAGAASRGSPSCPTSTWPARAAPPSPPSSPSSSAERSEGSDGRLMTLRNGDDRSSLIPVFGAPKEPTRSDVASFHFLLGPRGPSSVSGLRSYSGHKVPGSGSTSGRSVSEIAS